MGVLVAAVVLVGGFMYFNGVADQIMTNVANDLGGSGTPRQTAVPPTDLPPAGDIWFGSTFDPDTFAIRNRTTTVGAHDAFAMVAHIGHTVDGSDFSIRIYYNGDLVTTTASSATGSGDIWGFSPGPLIEPGVWKYELIDVGGNVLASGEITAA